MTIAIASGTPAFFSELTLLVVAAAVVAYVGYRLGLLPIVGFLLAGTVVGPNALGLVHDMELVEAMAEIGVILLLFAIGIEFSLDRLAQITRLIFVGGGLQVGLTTLVVAGILVGFDVDWRAAVFTGMLVALSSTAIVLKILSDRGEGAQPHGEVALGLLIFQDLAIIVMVLAVPILSGEAGGAAQIGLALGKAGALIALVLVGARRLMPKVLEVVAQTCSPEIFLLTLAAICFGTAYITSLAGVSVSLGAFLAGLVVSESRFSEHALGEILPLKVLFSAAFFVSCGMLLDVGFALNHLPLIAASIVGVVVLKGLITWFATVVLGYRGGTAIASGLVLAQVGEFSFVLERAGGPVGLSPGGLGPDGSQAFIATTVLLMVVTPQLAGLGVWLGNKWDARAKEARKVAPEAAAHGEFADMDGHVVIAGYGDGAARLVQTLAMNDVPFVIATLSPAGARAAEADGHRVHRADYTRAHALDHLGISRARLVVVADDDLGVASRTAHMIRGMAPDVHIISRTQHSEDRSGLIGSGASVVISEDAESMAAVALSVLECWDVPKDRVGFALDAVRRLPVGKRSLNPAVPLMVNAEGGCAHNEGMEPMAPRAVGCEVCLDHGGDWVHLRICMTCGHVGCCDSSPGKHATAHFKESGHPIMRSGERGEDWAWCFEDRVSF